MSTKKETAENNKYIQMYIDANSQDKEKASLANAKSAYRTLSSNLRKAYMQECIEIEAAEDTLASGQETLAKSYTNPSGDIKLIVESLNNVKMFQKSLDDAKARVETIKEIAKSLDIDVTKTVD